MSNKMIYLATIGLLTFNGCNGMNNNVSEKDVFDYCKSELDNAIINRYIRKGAIKNYKPKKEVSLYENFLNKLEMHPKTKGNDLRDFVLYRSSSNFYKIKDGVCRISGNVLAISRCVFRNNKTIEEFILPNGLLGIDCFAFAGTNIEDIYIPDSVVALAPYAFYNCKNLKSVSVSKNTLGIEDAFIGCGEIEFDYR